VALARNSIPSGQHISSEDIAAFVDKKVSARERKAIMLHLVSCDKCRRIVSEVALSQADVKDPIECPRRPSRYRV
jgi:hypothetical protein